MSVKNGEEMIINGIVLEELLTDNVIPYSIFMSDLKNIQVTNVTYQNSQIRLFEFELSDSVLISDVFLSENTVNNSGN